MVCELSQLSPLAPRPTNNRLTLSAFARFTVLPYCTLSPRSKVNIRFTGTLAACRKNGVSLVAYSPLGRGFLTGAFTKPEDLPEDDYRRRFSPRFEKDNFKQNLKLVEKVKEIAAAKGVTASQIALAWVLAQGEDIIPIPGTKRRTWLDQNMAALDVVLSAAELAELDKSFPPDATAGLRYPESFMGSVNA